MEPKVLGQKSAFPGKYDPSFLDPVARSENRELYNISDVNPGFVGFDVWHAWEIGFLTNNGLPVAGVLKIIYPQSSPFIIESKSLKLYLNSFNMTHLGNSPQEGISLLLQTVQNDLDRVLESRPTVAFFSGANESGFDFNEFSILEETFDFSNIKFSDFVETPELLLQGDGINDLRWTSNLLRSNCKVTFQPDWGSVFIHLKGEKGPSPEGLIKYLVSFRNENHFHEEVCEMIYKRLWDAFAPEELMVVCLYTRRGGIDICPVRASHTNLLPKALLNPRLVSDKLFRQ